MIYSWSVKEYFALALFANPWKTMSFLFDLRILVLINVHHLEWQSIFKISYKCTICFSTCSTGIIHLFRTLTLMLKKHWRKWKQRKRKIHPPGEMETVPLRLVECWQHNYPNPCPPSPPPPRTALPPDSVVLEYLG